MKDLLDENREQIDAIKNKENDGVDIIDEKDEKSEKS